MESFIIEGGHPLTGTIIPQGAKNEALEVICTTILTDEPVRIKALMSALVEGEGSPGQVLDDVLTVACGTGAVRLTRVQRPGKAAQSAEEMLRGFAVPAGTVLG